MPTITAATSVAASMYIFILDTLDGSCQHSGADGRRRTPEPSIKRLSSMLHECPAPAARWNRVTRVNAAAGRCVGWFAPVLHAHATVLTRLERGVRVRGNFRCIRDESERLRGRISRIEWRQVSSSRIY